MLRGGKCDSDGFFAFPESSIGGGRENEQRLAAGQTDPQEMVAMPTEDIKLMSLLQVCDINVNSVWRGCVFFKAYEDSGLRKYVSVGTVTAFFESCVKPRRRTFLRSQESDHEKAAHRNRRRSFVIHEQSAISICERSRGFSECPARDEQCSGST